MKDKLIGVCIWGFILAILVTVVVTSIPEKIEVGQIWYSPISDTVDNPFCEEDGFCVQVIAIEDNWVYYKSWRRSATQLNSWEGSNTKSWVRQGSTVIFDNGGKK